MSQPFMLDAPLVARALNISTSSLYKLVRAGECPIEAQRLGKLLRFKRSDVEGYLGVPLAEALNDEVPA